MTTNHDEEKPPGRVRFDAVLWQRVKSFTESTLFNGTIMTVIVLNSLFIALEAEPQVSGRVGPIFFPLCDNIFMTVYTVEYILKIYAEPKNYWTSSYNVFDFVILVMSWTEPVLQLLGTSSGTDLGPLRVLRALRTLRMLRTVSFIRGLQVLVTALVDTIKKWVLNIMALLALLMFLFAIIGYYSFGDPDTGDPDNWGSLGASLLTLLSLVTVEGWTDFVFTMDELGLSSGRVYAITFIFIGNFIFTNIFVAVIIMNISDATDAVKEEERRARQAVVQHKKDFVRSKQHDDVTRLMERQKEGNYASFHDMVREFQDSLPHDEAVMTSDLCTNLIWMETFINTLDDMDESLINIQRLHFEMANLLAQEQEKKLKEGKE